MKPNHKGNQGRRAKSVPQKKRKLDTQNPEVQKRVQKKSLKKEKFADVETLQAQITQTLPPTGIYKPQDLPENEESHKNSSVSMLNATRFADLPLSKHSIMGLKTAKYVNLTETQRATIPHALGGRDMLVAAKTGSGKTLSFLIPAIEKLYAERWTNFDGLGVLILVPVRELAMQIFDVLKSFCSLHDFSAGLIIGGKDVDVEKSRIGKINVLIATPGRLLHHMDQTYGFYTDNLKLLIFDEADRTLDMGFDQDINSILNNLPKSRQTLLFSATLSKSIRTLAKLSLRKPEYIFLHQDSDKVLNAGLTANSEKTTSEGDASSKDLSMPKRLAQFYMECNLADKLDLLFSFMKSHQQTKSIIFFSSCKQVRFAYEAFKLLKPGVSLMELHGRMKQEKRVNIYYEFSKKKFAALFATDIASRGMDFPRVDWVIQVDCAEDPQTYVHRVGRTARYKAGGNSLAFFAKSELSMITKLKEKGVVMKKIQSNPKKALTIKSSLQSLCSEHADLKYLAQKSFVSYVRSIYLTPDKEVFKVDDLPLEEYAQSLGLMIRPQIKFVTGPSAKNTSYDNQKATEEEMGLLSQDLTPQPIEEEKPKKKSKLAKLKEKLKQKKLDALKKAGQADKDDQEEQKKKTSTDDNDKEVSQKEAMEIDLNTPESDDEETSDDDQFENDEDREKYLERKEKFKARNDNIDRVDRKFKKMKNRRTKLQFMEATEKLRTVEDSGDADDLLVKKTDNRAIDKLDVGGIPKLPRLSKRQLNKIKPDGHYGGKNITRFDEDGNPIKPELSMFESARTAADVSGDSTHIQSLVEKMKEQDQIDKLEHKEKLQQKKLKKKESRKRQKLGENDAEGPVAIFAGDGEGSEQGQSDDE